MSIRFAIVFVAVTAVAWAQQPSKPLNTMQQQTLLSIAKKTLKDVVEIGKVPVFTLKDPVYGRPQAVFVTIETKDGQLRGCIGNLFPKDSLLKSTQDMTKAAAMEDPRFAPIKPEELPGLKIKLSLLTMPQDINSIQDIKLGRDGVILLIEGRSAVYLPEVALEQAWALDELLTNLCDKGGWEKKCWMRHDAKFKVFQTQSFE